MQGQQLAQELAYQANVLQKLEKVNDKHQSYVAAKNQEKAGGFGLKEMIIVAVILGAIGIGGANSVLLAIVLIAAVFGAYYYHRSKRNGKIDQEISAEDATFQRDYNNVLQQLTTGNHPKFNLPEDSYNSFYLTRLYKIIATNQAQDLGTAVRILEDRLRSEANTRAVNRAADNSVLAAQAANRAADNSMIAASWSAYSAAASNNAAAASNRATAASNRAAAASNRAANNAARNNNVLNNINSKLK